MDRKAVFFFFFRARVMIEGVLAFLVSGWKHNRCVPLPKMTVEHVDGVLSSTREFDAGEGSAG